MSGSLVDVVKEHIRYLVNDNAKTAQEKILGILDLTARVTRQATLVNDQETLDFFLGRGYVAILAQQSNLIAIPVEPSVPKLECEDNDIQVPLLTVSEDTEPLVKKYRIEPDHRYQMIDSIKLLIGDEPASAEQKNKIMRWYSRITNAKSLKDIVVEEQAGERKRRYVLGKDIPKIWRYLTENYDDCKGLLSDETPRSHMVETPLEGVKSDDIVTFDNLAELLRLSRDDLRARNLPFEEAGTAKYLHVKAIAGLLNEDQRKRLKEYVE